MDALQLTTRAQLWPHNSPPQDQPHVLHYLADTGLMAGMGGGTLLAADAGVGAGAQIVGAIASSSGTRVRVLCVAGLKPIRGTETLGALRHGATGLLQKCQHVAGAETSKAGRIAHGRKHQCTCRAHCEEGGARLLPRLLGGRKGLLHGRNKGHRCGIGNRRATPRGGFPTAHEGCKHETHR